MANGFDPTDPTQLTASSETEANAPIPMEDLNDTQFDPSDPNVMFSEAALQRDKDFRDIDTYTELGLSANDIVSIMGSEEGRSPQEAASIISSKYEIEQAERRLESEKYKAEFEENKRNTEKRQQALKDLRLKKKVSPSELDGGFSEPGLDGSELKEAVASPELAAEYAAIEGDPRFSGYTNYYDGVEGIDSPEMIRLAGVNASLANDASMQFYSDELLESLADGDMATAKEMFEALESMGAEVPEGLKKETGFIGGGIETVSDYFADSYRGKDDETLKAELLTWGQGQKEKYKNDAVVHMTELKGAYENLGIDYDLNPESDLDMRQAILESYDLDEGLSMTTEAYKISERAKDIGGRQMSWLEQRTVGIQSMVGNFASMGLNLGGVLERLSGNEMEAEAKFRAAGYVDEVMEEKAKTKRDQMGIDENVQGMGLGESWRADDVSVGQSMLKTLDFIGGLLPDVVFAVSTIGTGTVLRSAALQASKKASQAVIGSAVKSAITKNLRREAKAAGKKAFRQAGGRAGTILKVGPSVLFGGRSAASTYQSVWDRPDMSEGDKLFLSTVVGVAEGALTYVFSGAEAAGATATRAWLTKAGGREGINKATLDALKGLNQKQIWFQGAKDAGSEWLEEAMIETIDQSTRNLIEWSNGREVKPIDWLAIEDAGLGGLLGSGPMAGIGAASRSYSHSKVSNLKVSLLNDLSNIDEQLLVVEDPAQREILKARRKSKLDNVASLDSESQVEFDKLTDTEKQAVGSLAREMATLKAEIDIAKDNNDTDTARILEKQFEQKFELKKEIEETASDREPVVNTVTAADSKGEDVVAVAKDVTPEQKAAKDATPEANAEQINNDSDTSEVAEESKSQKKLTSALTSLDKYLGLTSSDPDNATAHKRIVKAQRTRAINLKAELKGGTVEAKAEATAEVDAYIEAKNLTRQAEAGGAAAVNEQGTAKLEAAKKLVAATEKGKEGPVISAARGGKEETTDLEDNSVTIEAGQNVDLSADWIGEGEGKINLTVVLQVQRLKKAFGKVLDRFGVKVQMHTTLDSFKKATGVDSYGMYVPGTKTIHISPKSTKSDVQEEFGHAVFRTIMSTDSKLRKSVYQELAQMNKLIMFNADGTVDTKEWVSSARRNEDGSIAGLNFVSKEKEAEYNSDPILKAFINDTFLYEGKPINEIQEETIMSVLTAYAANSDAFTKTQKGEGFINRLIRQFNRIMKIGGYKGNYISSQDSFFSMAAKFKQATEGVETDVEVRSEDYTDSKEAGLESRKFAPRPNLDNAEIFFTQTVFRINKLGTSSAVSVREKSIKVKDYWHFYNLYAKLTGNGAAAGRMEGMSYIKDGIKYPLAPPSPKRDKNTREVLEMSVPYVKTYQEFQGGLRQQESKLEDELSVQWGSLTKEVSTLFRSSDKRIDLYTQEMDFQPINVEEVGYEGADALSKQIESLAIAKKNIQALIDSDLTTEDLKTLAGNRGLPIDKDTNPDIFNMSGLTPFSEAQDGDAVGEESVPNMGGLESRKFEMKGSLAKVLTDSTGDLGEISGVMSRLFGYDRTMKGSGLRSLMNQTFNLDGKDVAVITAHRGAKEARLVFNDLAKMVKNELEGMEVGEIGYIATMEALLGEESTLGNPGVFKRIVKKYAGLESLQNMLNIGKNSRYKSTRLQFRNLIEDGAISENASSLIQLFETTSLADDIILEEAHVNIIKKILTPSKDSRSFKLRTALSKAMLSDSEKQEVYKNENDPAWENVQTAEITSFTKIPFRKTEQGWEGFTKRFDKKAAFGGLIVADGTIEEQPQLKIAKELFTIPEVFPDLKVKMDVKTEIKEGNIVVGLKEADGKKPKKVLVPISELSPDEQMKQASTRAAISRVEGRALTSQWSVANDTVQDTAKQETVGQESRKFESRGGMTEAETDSGPFQLREKTWFQEWKGKWLRRLADKYRDVLLIQEDIEASKGAPVKESQDFKMAEERMYGKAANDLQKLEDKTKEMTTMMKEMGLTQGVVTDYLYALHAKERNALILERDGVENGSGMTDAEAEVIISGLDPSTKANLDKVVDIVRDIQQDTRNAMVKFGLESQETIDVFEAQFKNYVPLAGIAKDEADSGSTRYPTGGAGLSIQGDSYKKAKGRESQADNLIAQIISQNASIHIAGRTNEALQSLHELVTENPNNKVWTILDTASYGDAHVVPVRINGEQKYIRFTDSSYAETLKGMSVPRTSALVKLLRAPANWLRRSFTTLNPEFVISNFSRDIQAAIFNAMAESDIEGGALLGTSAVKDMLKMVGPSLKTLVKGVAGKSGDPMIEKYYTEFQEDGGKTGWAYAKNLADIAADIEKETTESSTAQNILGKAKDFADTIEGVNDAFENSIRLAAYIGARENGVSRGKAAQLAKNITVNFNKSGEYGQALNAVYLFFNASIQGTMRLGKSLMGSKAARPDGIKESWMKRRTNGQKIASGLVVFNAMLTMIGRAMSEDDEDGTLYYDKIPDYIKERNLIFMFDGENYLKVPMPYGFNVFANLGSAAVEVSEGVKEVDEAMMFLANSFMGAFSPVSFGQSKDLFTSLGKSATPTVLKPLVEIMTNETYFGGPVYAAQSPYGSPKPESSMSFRSPKAVQEFFEWMNETTGGSKHVPGNLDMNPDKFWHIFDYYLGGAGQFLARAGETTYKMGTKLAVDDKVQVEFNDVPMLRKMYGEPSKYYDFEKFKNSEVEITQLVREYKKDRSEDMSRYKDLGTLNNTLKAVNKQLKVLRAKKREARDIDNYAERSIRIQELMDKERSLIMKFNAIYEKTRNNE